MGGRQTASQELLLRDGASPLERLDDLQMAKLAKECERPLVADQGGNPGILLFDLDSLRTEFEKLSQESRDVWGSVNVLFFSGIDDISADLVRDTTRALYETDLDGTSVREILKGLKQLSFLREHEPVRPEEAYLIALLPKVDARQQSAEIRDILIARKDPNQLNSMGALLYNLGGHDEAVLALRAASVLLRMDLTAKDKARLALARISHEWCPRLHLGEGKGVGSWLAGAKMPTELRKWAWMTGVAGNGEVKSDYRDSYPDQRREGWDV